MEEALALSDASRRTAGILLLSILAIEFGGWYMLRILQRKVDLTGFQRAFSRAGHAHAGVLVILSLVIQIYADAAAPGNALASVGRSAVPLAAILMPAGFFFSAMGAGRERPSRWIALVAVGALVLAAAVVTLGVGLLTS